MSMGGGRLRSMVWRWWTGASPSGAHPAGAVFRWPHKGLRSWPYCITGCITAASPESKSCERLPALNSKFLHLYGFNAHVPLHLNLRWCVRCGTGALPPMPFQSGRWSIFYGI
jgi:hypothetical protein